MQASLNLESISPYRIEKKHPHHPSVSPALFQKSISLVSRDNNPKIGSQQGNIRNANRHEIGNSLSSKIFHEPNGSENEKKLNLSLFSSRIEDSVATPTMITPEDCLGSQYELSHSAHIQG